jgi:type VI secretion system protein ImpG
MSDSLDGWYQRELDFFRSTVTEFSDRFPRIANRLTLSAAGTRDPHVERLIQAFAYLNARTRLKLDDTFPELVDAMLGVLYPHMVAPVPSMSVIGFKLNRTQKDLTKGHLLSRATILESEKVQGSHCYFRTCYPVNLLPMEATTTRLLPRPFSGPPSPRRNEAESTLRFEFSTLDPAKSFGEYNLSSLRFYIGIPNFEKAAQLLELLLTQSLEVVITGAGGAYCGVLPASCVQQVGFAPEDAVLPQSKKSFPGYRLLTEYFVLPQKFLFFDITGFTPSMLKQAGNRLEISILLKEHDASVAALVSPDSVRTGCTPIINLFRKTADGAPLTLRTTEVRIIPDSREATAHEIYSIENVQVDTQDGTIYEFRPFYSVSHGASEPPIVDGGFWHAVRRPGPVERDRGSLKDATDMYLTLVDANASPFEQSEGTLVADLVCFNRDLPEMLAEKREVSRIGFDLTGGRGPVSEVKCLISPTPVFRGHLGRRNLWPLISQLSLNHLSLSTDENAVKALQEILALNDVRESAETRNLIAGIQKIITEPCVQRMGGAFARGTRIQLQLNEENFAGDSPYLFSAVLGQFFAMYSSINSFTQLTATTQLRLSRGLGNWKWPAQAGNQALI